MAVKKFELDQVLNYRCEIEKVRKQEYANAKTELEQAHDVLARHTSQVNRLAEEFSQCQSELHSIEELSMYVHFFARKRKEIINQKEQINHLDGVVDERREYLLDATKDKKVLESLKEKRIRGLKMELIQKERLFIDEIAVQKKDRMS